jgi:hypothetical protein
MVVGLAVLPGIGEDFGISPVRDLERIEGSQAFGDRQMHCHDHDRHVGEGGGERDVARGALVHVDRLADEETR